MQEKECKSCKNQNIIPNYEKWAVILGAYIFIASIYGTIEIIKKIIQLFP